MNATVFAYGATGAGKTHTMMGDADNAGIIPRAVADLFGRGIDGLSVTVSYLEVYNERIYDLLSSDEKLKVLEPREDPKKNIVVVAGLSHEEANSEADVMALISEGNKRRRMEPTAANKVSSRSHAVLQLHIVRHALPASASSSSSSSSSSASSFSTLYKISLST